MSHPAWSTYTPTAVTEITGLSIEADPVAARSGVMTWMDAGSFEADQATGFRRFVVGSQQAHIFGYVHQYPNLRNPDIDPVKYARSQIRPTGNAIAAHRDIILGIKIYVGSNMNGRYSLDFLKAGGDLYDEFKVPMMAHISFAPPETDEGMELMRPGDVVTHCFNTHTLGIFDPAGHVKAGVRDARTRGVLFDGSTWATEQAASISTSRAKLLTPVSRPTRSRPISTTSTSTARSTTCPRRCRSFSCWG
jgi:dihydroorotase